MQSRLSALEIAVLHEIENITEEDALIEYRNSIFGKNGSLTQLLKGLKDLSPEERTTIGTIANTLRDTLQLAFEQKKSLLKEIAINERIKNEYEDVTLPFSIRPGTLHPITLVRQDVEDIFVRMGFTIHEAMEATTEYLNFDAVNVPHHHPARDMQDTFWLEGEQKVLSTQTSCMQNLILRNSSVPIRAIIPGRVFRNEDIDATHENTFYQVEGIMVDKNIGIGHLKYTITTMLQDLFGKNITLRMRPGYFPFVEPGIEIDFSCPFCQEGSTCRVCKGSKWIEFMGSGMIHPNVLREGGLNPSEYSGFAFGFGLNRLAMIKYDIPDIRLYMQGDIRFLQQF